MNDENPTQEEIVDDLAFSVDMLIIDNLALRLQMKALEESLLDLISAHPQSKNSMLEVYALQLKKNISFMDVAKDGLRFEENEVLVEKKKDEIQEQINKILSLRDGKPPVLN